MATPLSTQEFVTAFVVEYEDNLAFRVEIFCVDHPIGHGLTTNTVIVYERERPLGTGIPHSPVRPLWKIIDEFPKLSASSPETLSGLVMPEISAIVDARLRLRAESKAKNPQQ
jgi:hypothetical protein